MCVYVCICVSKSKSERSRHDTKLAVVFLKRRSIVRSHYFSKWFKVLKISMCTQKTHCDQCSRVTLLYSAFHYMNIYAYTVHMYVYIYTYCVYIYIQLCLICIYIYVYIYTDNESTFLCNKQQIINNTLAKTKHIKQNHSVFWQTLSLLFDALSHLPFSDLGLCLWRRTLSHWRNW